jgi:hypothetical protein
VTAGLRASPVLAPKGHDSTPWGNAPGIRRAKIVSSERAEPFSHPFRAGRFQNLFPKALPWAIKFRSVGAEAFVQEVRCAQPPTNLRQGQLSRFQRDFSLHKFTYLGRLPPFGGGCSNAVLASASVTITLHPHSHQKRWFRLSSVARHGAAPKHVLGAGSRLSGGRRISPQPYSSPAILL